jgi:hypothetical protein
MKSLDSRQKCDVIGQCLQIMKPDEKDRIGRIFDMNRINFHRKM